MFVQQLVHANKKKSILGISGPLWGNTHVNGGFPSQGRKHFHITMLRNWEITKSVPACSETYWWLHSILQHILACKSFKWLEIKSGIWNFDVLIERLLSYGQVTNNAIGKIQRLIRYKLVLLCYWITLLIIIKQSPPSKEGCNYSAMPLLQRSS